MLFRSAIRHKLSTAFFSLEMSQSEIVMRLLAAEAGVMLNSIRNGGLGEDEWSRIVARTKSFEDAPLFIDDSPNLTMMEIRAKARRLKQRHDLRFVVIDYMQLMSSGKKVESRQLEVSEFSRQIKLLAKELDIPVLLLSQLNRASDGTIDHRPTLSNLRESGAIEQDADMVMLLCRPALYGKTVDKKSTYPTDGLGIVIIAKHRNGKTGEVYFHHNQSMTKLVDYIPPLEWLTRNAK